MKVALWLAAALALAAPAARADDDRRAEADRLFYVGKYQQALDLYQALANETGSPGYLCNVGRCHARLGKPEQAIQNMRACLARANLDRAKRREYEARVRELERDLQVGSRQESAGDSPASAPPPAAAAAVPPPPTSTTASAASPPVFADPPTAGAYPYPNPLAEPPRLLIPAAPPRSRSAWPYAMSALGAVGLAVGVGFGIQAQDLADQLGHRYDPALVDKSHTANGLQTIGYLTAITGIVLAYITSGSDKGGR